MLFNSIEFLAIFLPLVLLVARFLRGQALLAWITISSFVFYGFVGHPWFLIPIGFTTVFDFYLAKKIHKAQAPLKNRLLALSLCGNLGLLFYFKYLGLFVHTFRTIFQLSGPGNFAVDVILPAGISFYTFQTLSYIIDVYSGSAEPEENFWKFAGFVSFFPHLLAGPLTRHNQLMPGLEKIAHEGIRPRWEEGIFLFVLGLSKKVLVADRVANLIDPIIHNIGTEGAFTSWLAVLGYGIQIYFDFSGYSDMAIGLGRLFGIELPQNFNQPCRALNPSDYWSRWHMTLSSWLRDYLYTPMVVRLIDAGFDVERCMTWCLVATMFLAGLWHGANWTFAIWGLYHGLLLFAYQTNKKAWNKWPEAIQKTVTFFGVTVSWVFFRSPGFQEIGSWFMALVGAHGLGIQFRPQLNLIVRLVLAFGIIYFTPNASNYKNFTKLPRLAHCCLGLLAVTALLFMNYSSRFLYFQF